MEHTFSPHAPTRRRCLESARQISHLLICVHQMRVPPVEMEPDVPAAVGAAALLNSQGEETPVDLTHRREELSAVHRRLRILQEAADRLDRQSLNSYRVKCLTLVVSVSALCLNETTPARTVPAVYDPRSGNDHGAAYMSVTRDV